MCWQKLQRDCLNIIWLMIFFLIKVDHFSLYFIEKSYKKFLSVFFKLFHVRQSLNFLLIESRFTDQHGQYGGHERGLDAELFFQSWDAPCFVLHHPIDNISKVSGGLEGSIGVIIQSIQPTEKKIPIDQPSQITTDYPSQ